MVKDVPRMCCPIETPKTRSKQRVCDRKRSKYWDVRTFQIFTMRSSGDLLKVFRSTA